MSGEFGYWTFGSFFHQKTMGLVEDLEGESVKESNKNWLSLFGAVHELAKAISRDEAADYDMRQCDHQGHVNALRGALDDVEKLIEGIGKRTDVPRDTDDENETPDTQPRIEG